MNGKGSKMVYEIWNDGRALARTISLEKAESFCYRMILAGFPNVKIKEIERMSK